MAINIPPMARKGLKFILRRASAHAFFCSSAFSPVYLLLHGKEISAGVGSWA
jgi:hypothetical protein